MLDLSVIYNKIEKNRYTIYNIIITIVIILIVLMSLIFYKNKKENKFNQRLFEVINNYDSDLNLLVNLYNNKNISANSKYFVGMVLAKKYFQNNMYNEAIDIYNNIYLNSKDNFIRDYSGYNLFRLYIFQKDGEKISYLYDQLVKNNSYVIDAVKEQYILYLLNDNNVEVAKNIINSIDKNKTNTELFNRINLYKNTYKFQ